MRKLIVMIVLAVTVSVTASAQTVFRDISYAEAVKAAKGEGKLVFIDFYTDWCGPCKMMAREVFPQKNLGDYMNEHFVSIKVNAEKGKGVALAKSYNIHAYPTFVILNGEGKEVNRTSGARDANNFVSELERMINPEKSPLVLKERYEAGDRTPQLMKDYAALLKDEALRDRKNNETKIGEVFKMVQGYFETLNDSQKLSDENLFVYTDYTRMNDDPAALFMKKNYKKFDKQVQPEIRKAIAKICEYAVFSYFTGYLPVDANALKMVKDDMKSFKVNNDGKYDKVLSFIDAYVGGDKKKYVDYCRTHFKDLHEEHQTYLLSTYSRLFTDADQNTKLKASRFMRDNLSELPFNTIYYAAMEIGKLEGKTK